MNGILDHIKLLPHVLSIFSPTVYFIGDLCLISSNELSSAMHSLPLSNSLLSCSLPAQIVLI